MGYKEAEEELDRMLGMVKPVRVEFAASVKRGCICTNQHRPDSAGYIHTSPCCEVHRVTRYARTKRDY